MPLFYFSKSMIIYCLIIKDSVTKHAKVVNNYSPTSAKMTVNSGAAGKAMAMFKSNICSKSTEEKKTETRRIKNSKQYTHSTKKTHIILNKI